MISFPYLPFVVIALALVPALVVWSQGRRLVRHAAEDDAVLAERMAAAQRRTGYVLFATTLVLILLAPWHAVWSLLLMLLLTQVADYPARRKIHGETWTLPAYLSFSLRSMVALSGFWALLALTPWLVHHAGAAALPAALVLAAVLTVWLVCFPQVFLALFRAKLLDNSALEPSLARVIAKAAVPMPRLWRSDPGGGLVPTAFALPSLRGGGVLFLQPLLDRLPPDETVAIFAHEVAHLEQFTRGVLRRGLAAGVALILFGVLLVPVLRSVAPAWIGPSLVVWPLVVLLGVRFRARAHQPLEIAGDRRAAELCGTPEALASALIRLYALTRMPRRLDVDVERWASHPSLARRVQALRQLTEAAPAAAHEPVSVVAADGRTLVTFDADGVRIAPAVAAGSAPAAAETGAGTGLLAYADLHELRIEFRGRQPHLIVRDRSGRVQHVPLREADAPGVHAVLDRIDGRLAPDMPRPSRVRRGALAAAAASVVSVFSPLPLLSVFVVTGLASFGASKLTLAAAAAASLAGAIWAGWTATGPGSAVTALALGALGLVLGWSAARDRDAGQSRGLQRAMAIVAVLVLAAGTVVTWTLGFLAEGASAWRLHQAAVTWPGTIVFPFALAAALASGRGGLRRALAAMAAALGAAPLVAASQWFVDATVDDPLVLEAPRLETVVARVESRQWIPAGEGGSFELSPGGRWIARYAHDDGAGEGETRFAVQGVSGTAFTLEGTDAAFVDDEHVAVVVESEDAVDLRVCRLQPGLPEVWRLRLPRVPVMEMSVAPDERRWRVTGWGELGEAVRFEGRVGQPGWKEHRWPVPGRVPNGMWYVGSGPQALWLALTESPPAWQTALNALGGASYAPGARSAAIVRVAGDTRAIATELRLNCVSPPVGQDAVACTAFDGRDTRIYRIGQRLAPLAIVRGAVWLLGDHADGTLTATLNGEYLLLQPAAGRIVRLDGVDDWLELAYANGRVAFSSISQTGEVLEIGRLHIP